MHQNISGRPPQKVRTTKVEIKRVFSTKEFQQIERRYGKISARNYKKNCIRETPAMQKLREAGAFIRPSISSDAKTKKNLSKKQRKRDAAKKTT